MNALTQAVERLTALYHDAARNGGPDLALAGVLKLLEAARDEYAAALDWCADEVIGLPGGDADAAAALKLVDDLTADLPADVVAFVPDDDGGDAA
jgi:hypothetical protein